MAVARDNTIARADDRHRAGDATGQPERPKPPDVSRQNHPSIRTADDLLIGQQQLHLFEQGSFRNAQAIFDPFSLQRYKAEATQP